MSKGNRNRQNRSGDGYKLNSNERKWLNEKVKQAVLEQSNIMSAELDAAWLWLLYQELDISTEECYRLYKLIEANHKELREFYEVNPLDGMGWLYVQKCKDAGMDVEKWQQE